MRVVTKDAKFSEVDETIVVAAMAGNASFPSNSRVPLGSLTSAQLCQLFDYCYLYNLGDFVVRNNLIGVHLEEGIETIQDLTDLGLDKLTAKVLLKRIASWKENGLPEGFHAKTSTESAVPSIISTSSTTTKTIAEKQLDDDFVAAQWRYCRAATDRIIDSAEAGDHLAQAYLSILYYRGETLVEKNRAKAEHCAIQAQPWLRENAGLGNMYAQFNLALCFDDARGVKQNIDEAVRYALLAAEQGHASSQYFLGQCYDEGAGVVLDETVAANYYKLAADQGHSSAQYNLGVNYASGTGVNKDMHEAIKYYRLAADQGDPTALFSLAKCYEVGRGGIVKDLKEAVRYFQLAADRGKKEAQFRLGCWCDEGYGVPKDEKEAARYYQLAADQGHTEAQFNMAVCYDEGSGVAVDENKAFLYFKLAANHGDADALYNVGRCYATGRGVLMDKLEAVRLYLLAAEQGQQEAIRKLGKL